MDDFALFAVSYEETPKLKNITFALLTGLGLKIHPTKGRFIPIVTSRSLRKGATFAANAIGARLPDIRYVGGWSTNSTVLEAKYIDFAMLPTPAARLFFSYLCKGSPHECC